MTQKEFNRLKVGDWVVITKPDHSHYSDYNAGDIAQIINKTATLGFHLSCNNHIIGDRESHFSRLELAPQCKTPLWKKMNGVKDD